MKREIMIFLFLGTFLLSLASIEGVGEQSYCAERTVDGAWCQNVPFEKVDQNYQSAPTRCSSFGPCKLGFCYDSTEGTCMPNTPQKVCNDAGGIWSEGENTPPQCSLGCCVLGDQAAFVTQVRCKKLASDYGLQTDFRSDINDEQSCLASVASNVEGACVFERDFQTTCQRLTQKECLDLGDGIQGETNFYEGRLCSDEKLATNCGQTQETKCVEDKDGVYFVDSCGNIANVYDASKINNKDYWGRIYDLDESCGTTSQNGNADSRACGNCDYYLGSTCKQFDRNEDSGKPNYGNYICRDLGCDDEEFKKKFGRDPEHGETWCSTNTEEADSPGSEYFREVCYNNEVTVENCAAFRQEICVQDSIEAGNLAHGFQVAACSANLWQDCIAQETEKDCENIDRRDCRWIPNGEENESGEAVHVCVPNYAPGFNFWEESNDATEICAVADTSCVARFEKSLIQAITGAEWECVENCECCVNDPDGDGNEDYSKCTGTDRWVNPKLSICSALGDCGVKENYIGEDGYNTKEELISFA